MRQFIIILVSHNINLKLTNWGDGTKVKQHGFSIWLEQRATPSSGPDFFKKSKGLLEYRKQALELKLFLLKLTEAIQSRNLPESEDFEVKSKEINLVSDFTKEFFFMEKDDSVNIPKFENLANFNRAKKTTP